MNQLAHINAQPSTYRALVDLKAQQLIINGMRHLKEIESDPISSTDPISSFLTKSMNMVFALKCMR